MAVADPSIDMRLPAIGKGYKLEDSSDGSCSARLGGVSPEMECRKWVRPSPRFFGARPASVGFRTLSNRLTEATTSLR